ncbi:MAG: CopD family protein [Pseudomonadota bacterium]
MLSTLAAANAIEILQILVKTAIYVGSLLAVGSALFLLLFRDAPETALDGARNGVVFAGTATIAFSIIGFFLQAAALGGSFGSAFDPEMIEVVLSPHGETMAMRVIGCTFMPMIANEKVRPGARASAMTGAILVCGSFALVGHALSPPQPLPGLLLFLHLIAVAAWIGALIPLAFAAGDLSPTEAGALAHRFGRFARVLVAVLILAGLLMFTTLTGSPLPWPDDPYSTGMLQKLIVVVVLLALALRNRNQSVPAMMAGDASAATTLRRTIALEGLAILLILLITAALTTLTSPA